MNNTEKTEETTKAPILSPLPVDAPTAEEQFDVAAGEVALQLIREKIGEIPLSEVRRLHVSPPALVSMGLLYAGNLVEDRLLFEGAFNPGFFDIADYDDMRARAIAYWHLTICERQDDGGPLRMLLVEAKPLRAKLLKAATYLWGDQPKIGDIVANIRSGHAYLNQADDMGALAKLFIDNWESAQGKCEVTREDVLQAQELGARFLEAMGKIKADEISNLEELRTQAGEYLRRGIENIKGAAAFVFRGDEKRLARYPSLSVMRRRRKSDVVEEEEPTETGTAEIPTAPVISPQAPQVQAVLAASE